MSEAPHADTTGSTGTCESCGRDDEAVVLVTRLYVTPEAWDTPGKVEAGDDEWWCFVCRTHYPHHIEGQDTGWPSPARPADAD